MRGIFFITLLLLGFNSFAQSVVTEVWSKEDSVAKARPTIPSGYGSFYYNKYKNQWWMVENGVRKRAFPGSSSYTSSNGLTLSGSNFKLGGALVNNTSISGAGAYTFGVSNATSLAFTSTGGATFQAAGTGIFQADDAQIIGTTSLRLWDGIGLGSSGQVLTSGGTYATWQTPSSGVGGSGTTNQIAYWTSSSAIGALTTATYPSLTELSYGKGVTSSIQTQLNSKGSGTVTSVGLVAGNNISISGSSPITTSGSFTASALPSGSDTEIQLNSSGNFAGDPGLTYVASTNALSNTGSAYTIATTPNASNWLTVTASGNTMTFNSNTITTSTGMVLAGSSISGTTTSNGDISFTPNGNGDIRLVSNGAGGAYIIVQGLPTSCSGVPTGGLANIAGVLNVCP